MKLKKKVVALLMCGAMGVLNCMPVCAATQADHQHNPVIVAIAIEPENHYVTENCIHCGTCTHCTDSVIYRDRTIKAECECGYILYTFDQVEISRSCNCNEPSCNY